MTSQLNSEIHNVEPSVIVELFQVDLKCKGTYYFHAGENGMDKKIIFQGIEYDSIPLKATGFEYKGDGRLPRPKLVISNHMGFMSIKAMYFDDFVSHKVTRIKTFIKFLDNLNFPNGINPYGEPDGEEAFSKDEFYVNQKITENKDLMEFELVSILELQDVRIPARRIMADYCSWIYRSSKGCGYNGVPVADLYNKKIQDAGYVGNLVGGESYLGDFQFLEDPPGTVSIPRWAQTGVYQKGQVVEVAPCGYNPETKPTTLYVCLADNMRSNPAYDEDNWVKDDCSKDLQGCRLRFGEGAPQGQESTKGIPFGAFPGVAKFLP